MDTYIYDSGYNAVVNDSHTHHDKHDNIAMVDMISNFINIDTERDNAPIGMTLRSHDMERGAGTLSLSNIVSGVVNSPTRRENKGITGCNRVAATVVDTDRAGCGVDRHTVTEAKTYSTHVHRYDHVNEIGHHDTSDRHINDMSSTADNLITAGAMTSDIEEDIHDIGHEQHCRRNGDVHIKDKNADNAIYMDDSDSAHIVVHNNVGNKADNEQNKNKVFASSIVMHGTVNNIPTLILFDSGAEGVFISDTLVQKHDLNTQHDNRSMIGVMADGSKRTIDRIVKGVTLQIQQYYDIVDMHVLPISQYGVILGVPWHESVNATTHHRHRMISLKQRYHNKTVNEIVLKQQRHDRRIQRNMNNNVSHVDSILISAVQLKKWMRQRSTYKDGAKVQEAPAMIYLIHITSVHEVSIDAEKHDKYHQKYTVLYPDVCGEIPSGLPPQRSYDHHIELEQGAQPINQQAYRASAADNDEIRKQVNEMLDKGWIRPSTSSFASPVLLVKKHDGSMRMCVDYRALNKLTIKDRYPLPHTDELTDRLSKARFLTKLDLRAGYHQVRITDKDIHKTAFTTRYGLYEYLVMPFGLCNAPSTFMRMMNDILRPLLDVCVIVFIDDILIYSETEQQHHINVCNVFDLLRQNKLYVKLSKCEFFKQEVEFLGHIVGNGQIKMCPSKVDAILNWPTPTSVTDVRSFLGLCNYYRKFIRGFSTIALPLTDATKNDITFIWASKQQVAFDQLKHAITSAPVLQLPNQLLKWVLYTDASGFAIGGVLCQPDVNNCLKPVIFLSHKLSGSELNWPVYEKEFYAIVYCLKQCQWYLQGNDVTIYTDHKSLQYFISQKSLSPKQSRWIEFLSAFYCNIEYKEGKYNVVADALSRRPDHQSNSTDERHNTDSHSTEIIRNAIRINSIIQQTVSTTFSNLFGISTFTVGDDYLDKVKQAYADDSVCKSIIEANGTPMYTISHGFIYKGTRLYIPPFDSLKSPLLYEYHDSASSAHRGIASTHERIKRHFYWPHMQHDIEEYCRTCKECQQSKVVNQLKNGLLQPLPIPNNKFDDISMDFITHLPTTTSGNNVILVIVDRLTKYARFIPLEAYHTHDLPAAQVTADAVFTYWCRIFDVPLTIVSDRDPQFTSKFWTALFEKYNTQLKLSTAYHPQTDGQTERTNRTLEEILRSYLSPTQTDWDTWLSSAEIAYNNTCHSSTGQTPHELVFNQHRRSMADFIALAHNTPSKAVITAEKRIQLAKQCIERAQKRQLQEANKHRRDIKYNVGDLVFISTEHITPTGTTSNKLMYKYMGPYRIIRRISDVAYEIKLPAKSKLHPVFYVNRLRKFYPRLEQFADDDGNDIEPPPAIVDEDYEWEVDQILKDRIAKNGQRQYLIKWKGYTSIHNTWEFIDNLVNAKGKIKEYHQQQHLQSIDKDLREVMRDAKNAARPNTDNIRAVNLNCITNLPHMMLSLSINY